MNPVYVDRILRSLQGITLTADEADTIINTVRSRVR